MLNAKFHITSVLLAFATAAIATPSVAQNTTPIKVGTILSVTGPDANTGFSLATGVRMAIDEINKAGGVAGRQLVLVQSDDQSDPTAAVNEARRLVLQEKVNFVVGPLASQRTLAVIPIMNEAKVLQITVSGSPQL